MKHNLKDRPRQNPDLRDMFKKVDDFEDWFQGLEKELREKAFKLVAEQSECFLEIVKMIDEILGEKDEEGL